MSDPWISIKGVGDWGWEWDAGRRGINGGKMGQL